MTAAPAGCHVGPAGRPAWVQSAGDGTRTPVVLVPGSGLDGAYWWSTPDGRPGWAPAVVADGRRCHVLDWPAHGHSGGADRLGTLSLRDVHRAVGALLERIGPAVVVTHSRSGPVGWALLDSHRPLVAALVGVAPSPPANLVPPGAAPAAGPVVPPRVRPGDVETPRFPPGAAARWAAYLRPESARTLDERNDVGGTGLRVALPRVDDPPVLVVTGDADPGHPRAADAAIADLFGGDHLWLPDAGLVGHGHLMMVELGNEAVAALVLDWVGRAR